MKGVNPLFPRGPCFLLLCLSGIRKSDSGLPHHPADPGTPQKDETKVVGKEDKKERTTQPNFPPLSPNLKLRVADVDEDGNLTFFQQILNLNSPESIHLHLPLDKMPQMPTMIDRLPISHPTRGDILEINNILPNTRDFIVPNHMRIKRFKTQNIREEPIDLEGEVHVVFDYTNYMLFKGDEKAMVEYISIFFNGVNNRFDTIRKTHPNFQIKFKVVGITLISSIGAQRFLQESKYGNGDFDIKSVLEKFSTWSYEHLGSNQDLVTLLTGDMLTDKTSSDDISGLAYVNGACLQRDKKFFGVSVAADAGGFFDGVWTVAHEIAHNLGASHDGMERVKGCPASQGFIMSYSGWGTKNKFYFSECSIQEMKRFIMSSGGRCLRITNSLQSQIPIKTTKNPGDVYGLNALCVKYSGKKDAVRDQTKYPDQICKNLICKYPVEGKKGFSYLTIYNHPPGDNSPCGKNGVLI